MDIKDRDGKNLTEAEESKKRARIHRRTIQKKGLNDLDNNDSMVTHVDIAQRRVSSQVGLRKHYWKTKLVEVMEFQLSYFKS